MALIRDDLVKEIILRCIIMVDPPQIIMRLDRFEVLDLWWIIIM